MQRLPDAASAAIEASARIPPVLLVGSILLGEDRAPLLSSYRETGVPVAVPPVAAVELIPGHAECRVPYFAPGTPALVTDGRVAHCAELPTGHYAVNVFAGVAGGEPSLNLGAPSTGENVIDFEGALDSGQSWSVPNELGDPAQVGASSALANQGLAGSFVIHDPTPDNTACATSTTQGLCTSGSVIVENAAGVDSAACLLPDCCTYVAHLCGLTTCAKTATAEGNIAAGPTRIVGTATNGAAIPDCVPFELPWQCCRATP